MTNPTMTKDQAEKLIEAETLKAHQEFKKAYIRLCEEHNLQIISFPVYTGDGRTTTRQAVGDYEP